MPQLREVALLSSGLEIARRSLQRRISELNLQAEELVEKLRWAELGLDDAGARRRTWLAKQDISLRLGSGVLGMHPVTLQDLSYAGLAVIVPERSAVDLPVGAPLLAELLPARVRFAVQVDQRGGGELRLRLENVDDLAKLPVELKRGLRLRRSLRVRPSGTSMGVEGHEAQVLDLSVTGAQVLVPVPIEETASWGLGAQVIFQDMRAMTSIVWVEPEGRSTRLGLNFTGVGSAFEAAVQKLVQQTERRRLAC